MSQAWPVIYGKPCEDYLEQLSRFETKVLIGVTIYFIPCFGTKLIYCILTLKVYWFYESIQSILKVVLGTH